MPFEIEFTSNDTRLNTGVHRYVAETKPVAGRCTGCAFKPTRLFGCDLTAMGTRPKCEPNLGREDGRSVRWVLAVHAKPEGG